MTLAGDTTHSLPDTFVRLAAASEHAALAALYAAWGYRAGIAPADVVYVAERSGTVVGIVRRSREDGLTMLRGMYVSPAARGTRVGTSLLAAFARDLGAGDCYCIPFAHLTAFYGKAGFVVMPELVAPAPLTARLQRYRLEGHDVLIMHRAAPHAERSDVGVADIERK
jgi:GNAT superfamily N-acetyltransferase